MQEERQTFKLLADPITAELKKQGLEDLTAGMLAGNLVQAQLDDIKVRGYNIMIMRQEASNTNSN